MYPGATHGEDMFYLFVTDMLPGVPTTNPAYTARLRMVRLWTNFAKYGNPTAILDNLVNVNWNPIRGAREYLTIGPQLIPGTSPSAARFNLWRNLEARFANF